MKLSRFFEPSVVNEVSLATYCLFVYAITTLPTLLVVGILIAVLRSLDPGEADWNAGPGEGFDPIDFLGIAVVSPVLETFVLGWLVVLAGRATNKRWRIALVVALVFSLLHGLLRPTWALTVFWPFVAMTMSFILWRRQSYWRAYIAACAPHMLNNVTAALLMMSGIL